MSATAVAVDGVSRSFGTVDAVAGVSLEVAGGSLLALVGPSGCGKTTLLRLIAGFERPDAGSIRIGDEVVAGPVWVPPERRRVGMLFQHLALFPHLDVAGNIAYGLRGLDKAARRRRVGALLDLVDLSGYEGRRTDELSGGQAQRVALARALAPDPAVVLLDEPFSSLDVALRSGVRAEVRRILHDAGTTAILVSHDQDEALSMGDEVAVMLSGRLVQRGTPEQVYRHPVDAEVASFLGDANLVEAATATALGLAAGGSGPTMVRPEDLDVVVADGRGGNGTVVDVAYYGHDQLVTVALDATGARLRARLHGRRRLDRGIAVNVTVNPAGPDF